MILFTRQSYKGKTTESDNRSMVARGWGWERNDYKNTRRFEG